MADIDSKFFKRFLTIERQLFTARDSRELLEKITKEAVALLDVHCASIYLLDESNSFLIREASSGVRKQNIAHREIPLSFRSSAVKALRTKKLVAVISSLTIPLIGFKRRVLGFLFLDTFGKQREFTTEERLFAECFSNLASIAIEQTRMKHGLQKTMDILSAYDEITKSPVHTLDIDKFMKSILKNTINALTMDGGLIQIYEQGTLVIKSFIGISKKVMHLFTGIKTGTGDTLFTSPKSVIIENIAENMNISRASREKLSKAGLYSIFKIPLIADKRTFGVLTVVSRQKKRFKKHEIDFLVNVGKHVGVMLENGLLFERMELSNKKIKALVKLNRLTVATLELPLLYEQVLNELPSLIPCYTSSIMLVDNKRKELRAVAVYGPRRQRRERFMTRLGKGITGHVAKTGKPANIPDVRKNKWYIKEIETVRSELTVPLIVKEKIIGVLNVESDKPNAFSDDHTELLTAFANELAIAIDNARLYQESQERTAQLELINRVTKGVGLTLDIDTLCMKLCQTIQGNFYYDYSFLFLLDEEKENFVLKGYAGMPIKVADYKQSVREGLLGQCFRDRKSLLENGTRSKRVLKTKFPDATNIRSKMHIPLISGEKVLGVLLLESRTKNAFTKWDLVAMETISEHIVSSLESAKLYTYLRQSLGELSGVYEIGVSISSSRNLDELLEKMYRRTSVMTGATTFYVALYNEKEDTVRFELDYEEGVKRQKETFKLNEIGGYTGWILKNNAALLVRDFKKDTGKYPVKPVFVGMRMKSYLGVPIRFEDRVIGVLSLQSLKPHAFDESTRRLFTTFANQLGVVIENARLFTEMDIVLKKLEHSYDETMRSLVSALDFRE
ncbi:MAG: GAF domain-containing protein, partial [Candidatus Cloacimonadota bacterium]